MEKTVKVFNSKMRSTGSEEIAKPQKQLPAIRPELSWPPRQPSFPILPPKKKIINDNTHLPERPGAIKRPAPETIESIAPISFKRQVLSELYKDGDVDKLAKSRTDTINLQRDWRQFSTNLPPTPGKVKSAVDVKSLATTKAKSLSSEERVMDFGNKPKSKDPRIRGERMGSMLLPNNNRSSQNLINRPSRGVPQIFPGPTQGFSDGVLHRSVLQRIPGSRKSTDPKAATVKEMAKPQEQLPTIRQELLWPPKQPSKNSKYKIP
ncbi:unnamed protein product [Ceutorhynchus assimilis]|uniref:Uncharacterized protein n=1 Tax=Ceutorhynchus assimilis TaxID=467358 RepID=A0A9N9MC58_9CUCU|nr:unnamed protein product [Ceutorhynchus assimilis]